MTHKISPSIINLMLECPRFFMLQVVKILMPVLFVSWPLTYYQKTKDKQERETKAHQELLRRKNIISNSGLTKFQKRRLLKLLEENKSMSEIVISLSYMPGMKFVYLSTKGDTQVMVFNALPRSYWEIESVINKIFKCNIELRSQLGFMRKEGQIKGKYFQI